MPDIQVIAELLLQRDAFLADLRAAQQEMEAFSQKASTPITAKLTLDVSGATTQFEVFKKILETQGINVPVNLAGMGGAGFGGGGNSYVNQSFTQTNVSQAVSTEFNSLVQNIDNSVMSTISQLFQQYRNVVNNVVNNSNSGGGGRGAGGGSWLPAGRGLTAMALVHAGSAVVNQEQLYGQRIADAMGNNRENIQAEIEHRTGYDSLFFGVGRLGRGLRETFGSDPTVADLQEDLRDIKRTEMGEAVVTGQAAFSDRAISARERNAAMATGGLARERIESQAQLREARSKIQRDREEQASKITANSIAQKAKINQKYDSLRDDWTNFQGVHGPIWSRMTVEQVEAQRAAELQALADTERPKYAALNKSAGSLNSEAVETQRIRDRDADADDLFRAAQTDARIAGVGVNQRAAQLALAGQPLESARQTFAAELQSRVTATRAEMERAYRRGDNAEGDRLNSELNAQRDANPTLLAANNQRLDVGENLRNISNAAQISNVAGAAGDELASARGVSGTAMSRLQREDAQRVDLLTKQADQLEKTNKAEADRMRGLADAEKQAGKSREEAMQTAQAYQRGEFVTNGATNTRLANLRAQGLFVQAGEDIANSSYDRQIRDVNHRSDLTDADKKAEVAAIEQERRASSGERAAARAQNAVRLNSQADVAGLRLNRRDSEAQLAELNERHREELYNAGGDPAATAALNRRHRIELQGFLNDNHPHVTTMSARDAYFSLQSSVLSDPTGNSGRSRAAARDAAMHELHNMHPPRPPPNRFLLRNSGGHHGEQISDAEAGVASAKGADDFQRHVDKFGEYVETLLTEAV